MGFPIGPMEYFSAPFFSGNAFQKKHKKDLGWRAAMLFLWNTFPDLILISCPARILDSPVNFVAFTTFLWLRGEMHLSLLWGWYWGK